MDELHAIAGGQKMGTLRRDRRRGRVSFVYEPAWQASPDRYPLSLSMPLTAGEHGHAVVEAFMWGLLPDNSGVLKRWAERFQVSLRNAFQLIAHVGEECAGAVQFVRPERAEAWMAGAETGTVEWLSEAEVADRIRSLLADHSAARKASDAGQFSLAGAQPKTGLLHDPVRDRWGVPSGRIPTTHIFKPATGAFDGYAENEHFCLRLASALGLSAAASQVRYFEDAAVIVVERYDRIAALSRIVRVHQEDMCQAMGLRPEAKYQSDGGPSARAILRLLREQSSTRATDEARFVDALIFQWLIGGTDAHAKNYSMLLAARNQARLAPLYDLSSALPYPQRIRPRDARLAMKVGSQYKLREIGAHEWAAFASENRIGREALFARILQLAEMLSGAAGEVGATIQRQGIKHDVVDRLMVELAVRAASCASVIREGKMRNVE